MTIIWFEEVINVAPDSAVKPDHPELSLQGSARMGRCQKCVHLPI